MPSSKPSSIQIHETKLPEKQKIQLHIFNADGLPILRCDYSVRVVIKDQGRSSAITLRSDKAKGRQDHAWYENLTSDIRAPATFTFQIWSSGLLARDTLVASSEPYSLERLIEMQDGRTDVLAAKRAKLILTAQNSSSPVVLEVSLREIITNTPREAEAHIARRNSMSSSIERPSSPVSPREEPKPATDPLSQLTSLILSADGFGHGGPGVVRPA